MRIKSIKLKKVCGTLAFFLIFQVFSLASWAKVNPGTVIYGVVPPFFGQLPLKSVTRKLPELRELGVDILWLSPIFSTDDPGDISYSVTDHFALRQDFGSEKDLHALINQAHHLRMKVILDFVPNHSSSKHPYFLHAQKNGPHSPYYHFYDRDQEGNPRYYFDWQHLPNFNFQNSKLRQKMKQAFKHWVQKFNVDGFRVDVAWGIRERDPKFWPELRQELNKLRPDLVLLAEASARDPYYLNNGFDLVYDWTHQLGQWSWHDVFQNPEIIGDKLEQVLTTSQQVAHQTLRFLNNNDTGERFITRHGLAFTKVAAVLQLTLPGIPLVYSGDEVGAQFEPYEDPEPINWSDPHQLRSFYQSLIDLRETRSDLHSGHFTILPIQNRKSTFAFFRKHLGYSSLIVLNFGKARSLNLHIPPNILTRPLPKNLLNLLDNKPKQAIYDPLSRNLQVFLQKHEALIVSLTEEAHSPRPHP